MAGAIIYWFVDPLAPNWRVEIEPLGQQRFRVAMTMKRFITGGEGEVGPVLKRTAEKLRRDTGARRIRRSRAYRRHRVPGRPSLRGSHTRWCNCTNASR